MLRPENSNLLSICPMQGLSERTVAVCIGKFTSQDSEAQAKLDLESASTLQAGRWRQEAGYSGKKIVPALNFLPFICKP